MSNRVEPIRSKRKIETIKKYIKGGGNWRNYALFVLGINFGLRIGDLLTLQIKDIINFDGEIKDRFEISEQKTGKTNIIKINDKAKEGINLLLKNTDIENNRENYLIYNTRDKFSSITRVQAYNIVRELCNRVGLTDLPVGTHTLRKTWGYHAWKANLSIEVIQKKYNHSSTSTTRHYLGIQRKDVDKAYDIVRL